MKREPNPYAQQPAYTVTQTMAISVPSVVAEDVLDGEDGGMNATDSAVLYELQSDMVELKSDVATLETNVTGLTLQLSAVNDDVSGLDYDVTNLIYSTIPTINTVVAETRAQANSAYNLASQKSQVGWLTTADYTTSKLRVTSGSGLKALQLTTEGQTATVFDLVKAVATSSSIPALTLSGFAGTYKDYNSTVLDYKLGLDFDFDTKQAYLIVKNGATENWQPYQLESGSSDVTVTNYLKKLNFEGDWNNKVIYFSGNFNGASTELHYYALAAGAFANAEYPRSQLKVNRSGLLYTTADGGNTWTLVGSSDSTSENYVKFSDENYLSEVVVRNENGSLVFKARTTGETDLSYFSLCAPSFYCGTGRDFEFRVVDVSDGSNIPGLQMRSRSSNWVTITGDNNSSSGSTSGSIAGVYELDIWYNGADSGSQMLPLVKDCNIEADKDVVNLSWAIGPSTSDAQDTSGMYTLLGNPIALYDSAYRDSGSSRIKGAVRVVDMHGTICWQRYSYTNKRWEIEPTGSSDSDSSSVPITNALATPDYGTPVSYLTIENVGDAYSASGMNNYADDSAFKQKSWEPARLQTIELGGTNGSNEFSGIVALRNYLAVPIKNPVGGKIQQQAPTNTEHVIMGVHNMGVLKFSSGMDYNSYQTFKIDLSPFMPSLHGSTEPITSKMRWLLNNTEKLAALLDS